MCYVYLRALLSQRRRGIFHLANDPSPAVRERVCHAFVLLLDIRLDFLMPFLREVVQYMLACTAEMNHPQLALEACEFWYVLCDAKVCEEVLRDSLPALIPILLKAMVYVIIRQLLYIL